MGWRGLACYSAAVKIFTKAVVIICALELELLKHINQ
jgi:hypothetical protein